MMKNEPVRLTTLGSEGGQIGLKRRWRGIEALVPKLLFPFLFAQDPNDAIVPS